MGLLTFSAASTAISLVKNTQKLGAGAALWALNNALCYTSREMRKDIYLLLNEMLMEDNNSVTVILQDAFFNGTLNLSKSNLKNKIMERKVY